MSIKALKDYTIICNEKGIASTVEGLKQFHADNKIKYQISKNI